MVDAVNQRILPDHPLPWTLAEVLAMPEEIGPRVELIDGALVLSPGPGGRHQRVLLRLAVALDKCAPEHLEVLPVVNVVLGPERLLIPDIAVTTCPGRDALCLEVADLLMAVEIISPSSRTYDMAQKRVLYADSGIRYYLLVDPNDRPSSAVLFRLDGDEYVEVTSSKVGRLRFDEPFLADLELP
jgi:Uma2 family endonuclease